MPSPLKSLKFATLSLLSLSAVTAAGAAQAQTPSLLFPIVQGARWSDTFGAPRVGHTHQGADLMAPKMRPLVACFAGTITIRRGRGTAGNWITLRGSGGWRAEYMHINNDTPGTNDGLGGDRYAFAPGLQSGDFVQAGQFLGYVGNSGNAESTGSHLHFEVHGPGGVINPATVLRAARILPSPQIVGIVLPSAPTPKPDGPLRVSGTVLSYSPDQGEAVIRVTSITEFGGSTVTLSPPRTKQVMLGSMPSLPALAIGSAITAEGKDGGQGLPLQATRVMMPHAESVAVSSQGIARGSTTAYGSLRAISEPLPERLMLDGFERATYQGWYLDGDCWGRGPETVYGSRRIPGAGGRGFLSTAHAQIGSAHTVSGTGRAVSPTFSVTHSRLRFLIGGGSFPGECGLNLLVDGKVVRSETGSGSDRLLPVEWEIGEFLGKRARLEIIDARRFGERAYVLLDQIELEGPAPVPAALERGPSPTAQASVSPVPTPTASRSPQIPQIRQKAVPPRATVLLPDGTRLEGARLMTLEATGYGPADNGTWGDRTALGTKVGYGMVAVDPKVIPLRTRLWVEGYGYCVALDTGGAIKGNRIDLGHDNQSDALRVGRKNLRVLVLD